jgi:hypothetical protein
MATDRQIAANRENAKKSTGPRTDPGKRRSRRNAFRHGLTAESVVTVLEDEAAYRKFEAIILRDYSPEMAIERALVVRLASLLWRLRRAVAIESGLFQIQAEIMRDRHLLDGHDDANDPLKVFYDLLRQPHRAPPRTDHGQAEMRETIDRDRISTSAESVSTRRTIDSAEMAVCLLRLENFNPNKLDLIGRYETRLWRQLAQTIVLIESLSRGKSSYPTYRRSFSSYRNL